jgi:hypothetical protein
VHTRDAITNGEHLADLLELHTPPVVCRREGRGRRRTWGRSRGAGCGRMGAATGQRYGSDEWEVGRAARHAGRAGAEGHP